MSTTRRTLLGLLALPAAVMVASMPAAAQKMPNIVMLMTDDTGWGDFGYMSGGGKALGHPTPNIDRIATEGAVFTNWYGQASCTAGRASFITGRIPIRSALSIVVAPGDPNALKKETPTIAEFFKKNGYTTYFSGKWHLGDKPDAYPIAHGFDEMKHFGAYYPGVYAYNDTSPRMHPWFPSYNAEFNKMYNSVVNLGGCGRNTRHEDRHYRLGLSGDVRSPAGGLGGRIYQGACQERQALLHGRQLHEDAQPE
jgi:Sulfatase